ncbi:MAG: RNA polymerase subunit sigma, partial [Bacteroidota bacterium]
EEAIAEAEKLELSGNHLYHSLLGNLYTGIDNQKALAHFQLSFDAAKSIAEKAIITKNINRLTAGFPG